MMSFIKNLQDILFNINTDNKYKKSMIIFNKSVPIDNNSKLYDKLKCWKKNINDISKLYNLIDNLSQYKLYDFLIDLHKLPFNILEIKNYLLIICIMLMLIFISIIVFSILYFCNN